MNNFGITQSVRTGYETKTQTAFRWSVEGLFERSRRVYLWTFTVREVMPSWWMAATWHRLQQFIMDVYGKPQGVRVFEWHQNHGLHVHCLLNVRIPVAQLRRYSRTLGFGRVHVVRANLGSARYLGKYLGKDAGRMPYGGRQWSRFGGAGVAVRGVRIVSAEVTQRNRVRAELVREGLNGREAWQASGDIVFRDMVVEGLRAMEGAQ